MTTLFQQTQKNFRRPQLKLELRSEYKKLNLQALVDTGFDDFLAINLDLAQKLRPQIIGQTKIQVAGGQRGYCKVVALNAKLFDKPNLIDVNLQALVLPAEKEIILGSALLEAIGLELNAAWVWDYAKQRISLVQ